MIEKKKTTDSEMREMFEFGEELGKGAFSLVYDGKRVEDGMEVAIKVWRERECVCLCVSFFFCFLN